jgi:amidophosphoribosyltransferase
VFGVYAPGVDVARLCFFGLFALQHRGQESAGIAVGNGRELIDRKGMGLASAVFDEEKLKQLAGDVGLGHVRYSTTGGNTLVNAQPMVAEHRSGRFAVAHNGNLVNYLPLREELEAEGFVFHATSDTEVIANLIARSPEPTLEEAVADAMGHMEGAYSLGVIGPDKLIAARDPHGVRPLSLARLNGGQYAVASEDCAYGVVGAQYIREVEPGEVVVMDENGLREFQAVPMGRKAVCIFEFIYFARPDSHIYGKSLYLSRQGMGHLLAQQAPTEADIVVGVPESAIPHAIGYSGVSKIPYQEGFIKNRYIFRTFIHPDQRLRELGVQMKLAPLKETLAGRRVIVVDDSIVRGTTTRQEVALMREAGAREIHLRICSPPIRYPCFYGVDTTAQGTLVASRMDVPDICEFLGADSLVYLTLDNLIASIGLPRRYFCTACFDRKYPIPVPRDVKISKFDLEKRAARPHCAL